MSGAVDTESNSGAPATSKAAIAAETTDIADGKVHPPSSYPGAAILGSLLGLALLGVAAVGIRDHLVRFGWISGTPWTESAASWIERSTWQNWMWPAAVALVVVGLLFVWIAIKPRRKTHETMDRYGVMWTRRGDAARRCSAALMEVPGVAHATTVVRRRSAKAVVTTSIPVDSELLRTTAIDALAPVRDSPRVKIREITRHHGKENS